MHFIVLEGGEGVGKSTQGRLLTQWLAAREIPFCAAREPGGTPMGEAVRDIFLHRNEVKIDPEAELLLVLAARVASVRDVVRPALERGEVVIMDRFDFSTLAYQGYGRGVELEVIRRINDFATGGLRPDAYLVLDLAPEDGRSRRSKAGERDDRMEESGIAFMQRVRDGFLELGRTDERARVIDAGQTAEDVHQAALEALAQILPETFSVDLG